MVEVTDLLRARSLPGRHNWQNAAAAYAAARALGISVEDAAMGLATFPGLAHRMETVAIVDGVRFVNDSKATQCRRRAAGAQRLPKSLLDRRRRPKDGGIDSLDDLFPRVAKAYLVGEAADAFAHTLDGNAAYTRSGTIEAASGY